MRLQDAERTEKTVKLKKQKTQQEKQFVQEFNTTVEEELKKKNLTIMEHEVIKKSKESGKLYGEAQQLMQLAQKKLKIAEKEKKKSTENLKQVSKLKDKVVSQIKKISRTLPRAAEPSDKKRKLGNSDDSLEQPISPSKRRKGCAVQAPAKNAQTTMKEFLKQSGMYVLFIYFF